MQRGANVELTREIPTLAHVMLGIDWYSGGETIIDQNLVFAAILCDEAGHARSAGDFVFFNQLSDPNLSVQQLDSKLGPDKEQIDIDLHAVPESINRIVAVLYLNEGTSRRRSLGQLRRCVLRVVNNDDDVELVRSEDLAPAFDSETAATLGEIYRHRGGWKFKVLGQGHTTGIRGIAADYRIPL
ncbi:TerD family protein [Gordonia sp. CPCC 205333]|uniref:TerD family protein n=1 Tax=Gordonia sp. CPCC 205333 TaxID=3140790 RepID=UPI003AF3CB39